MIVDVGGGIGSTSMLLASAFSSSTDQNLEFHFVIQDRAVVVEMGEKVTRNICIIIVAGVDAFVRRGR